MTRREWFLDLGAGVVLAGISAAELEGTELLPGLYEPSRDHLSHALTGRKLDAGSETEFVQVSTGPAFFELGEYIILDQLVALLLDEPRDSPVVKEVVQWIDLTLANSAAVRSDARALSPAHRKLAIHFYGTAAVRRLEEFDPQAICREGLAWLNRERSLLQRSFAEVLQMLRTISDDRPEPRTENAGTRFFTFLKTRVVEGFYTSRAGLEELGRGQHNFHASPPGCDHKIKKY